MQPPVSYTHLLAEQLVAAVPVIADGVRADEDPWLRFGVLALAGAGDTRYEVRGSRRPARANPLARARRPALRDVLTGQVHDRIDGCERVRRCRLACRLPADCASIAAATERHHLVAAGLQRAHQPAADEAPGAGDCDAHHCSS